MASGRRNVRQKSLCGKHALNKSSRSLADVGKTCKGGSIAAGAFAISCSINWAYIVVPIQFPRRL